MDLLLCAFSLDSQVISQHLNLWFGAENPQPRSEKSSLFIGRSTTLPLGIQLGLTAYPAYFFSKDNDFAVVAGLFDWPEIHAFLAAKDPDFLGALANAHHRAPAEFISEQRSGYAAVRPQVMGILNLTPDSFYDGGLYQETDQALAQAQRMIDEGADWLDLGGESTRPGSESVTTEEEIKRILPALKAIKSRWSIPLSVDTTKPSVAKAALEAGASMINDVSGLSGGEEMLHWVRHFDAGYVLMHTQGTPKSMQVAPTYRNPVLDVAEFFEQRLALCQQSGLPKNRILLDSGIGFGKLLGHNLELLRMHSVWGSLGCQTLLGTSNKSFISKALEIDPLERQSASLATQVLGFQEGAQFFRVHQVKETRQALDMAWAYQNIQEE